MNSARILTRPVQGQARQIDMRFKARRFKPRPTKAYIGGVGYSITGTPARYLWVSVDNPGAEWKTTTVTPFPPGVEIYDMAEVAVHIPRFG